MNEKIRRIEGMLLAKGMKRARLITTFDIFLIKIGAIQEPLAFRPWPIRLAGYLIPSLIFALLLSWSLFSAAGGKPFTIGNYGNRTVEGFFICVVFSSFISSALLTWLVGKALKTAKLPPWKDI